MLIRALVGIVVGYGISAATWVGVVSALFGEAEVPPNQPELILSFGTLLIGAAIGGFFFTLIVGLANSPGIYVTIGIIAVMLGRELYLGRSGAPDWYLTTGFLALAIGFMIGASAGAYRLDRA